MTDLYSTSLDIIYCQLAYYSYDIINETIDESALLPL